jgi:hypothetical protein
MKVRGHGAAARQRTGGELLTSKPPPLSSFTSPCFLDLAVSAVSLGGTGGGGGVEDGTGGG